MAGWLGGWVGKGLPQKVWKHIKSQVCHEQLCGNLFYTPRTKSIIRTGPTWATANLFLLFSLLL